MKDELAILEVISMIMESSSSTDRAYVVGHTGNEVASRQH